MRKHNRKVAFIVLFLVVVGSFLYFLTGFVPVAGKMIALGKLNAYSESPIDAVVFDWHDGGYVTGFDDGQMLRYNLRHNTLFDMRASDEISNRANQKYQLIKNEFPSNLTMPTDIFVWTEINADDYTAKSQMVYILSIVNDEKLTAEQSAQMPGEIAELFIELMGREFSFTGIQLNYGDINGMYELHIKPDRFRLLLDYRFEKNTRQFSENELPLDYIEWLKDVSTSSSGNVKLFR